jgi:pyrroloquinoline quinone (PQQ) biosynthesis protein C
MAMMGASVGTGQQLTAAAAAERVASIRRLVAERFDRQVFQHPFMRALEAGTLSRERVRGFVVNHYTFALEINTVKALAYHRLLPFLKRHPAIYDLIVEQLADELTHPGPGGHIRMKVPLLEAFGSSEAEAAGCVLIPEARALVDCRVRLYLEGPMAEAYATSLSEQQVGEWFGRWYTALTRHYGLTPAQAVYFHTHHEADTQEHDGGAAHGTVNARIVEACLIDGYRPERPGYTLESAATLSIDLYELFMDGVLKRYP